MSYQLLAKRSADKALEDLESKDRVKVRDRIRRLAEDPRAHDVVKLKNAEAYRVRVGDYRVVFAIDDGVRTVTILVVDHRRDVYR